MSVKLRIRNHPSMFQRDADDTSPDLRALHVLKTFEMAIRRKRRTTRTELSFLSLGLFSLIFKNISLALLEGAIAPAMDPPLL